MTKHTPGPWKVSTTYAGAQRGRYSIVPWADQSLSVAVVNRTENQTAQEGQANARLIAAAPALAAALAELANAAHLVNSKQHAGAPVTPANWSELYDATNKARAALAQLERTGA